VRGERHNESVTGDIARAATRREERRVAALQAGSRRVQRAREEANPRRRSKRPPRARHVVVHAQVARRRVPLSRTRLLPVATACGEMMRRVDDEVIAAPPAYRSVHVQRNAF